MPKKMPVFVLKAQDELAIPTILFYMRSLEKFGLMDQSAEVSKALDEFKEWEQENPDKMKMPDHKHVPASEE
jgi:hypothetical protein